MPIYTANYYCTRCKRSHVKTIVATNSTAAADLAPRFIQKGNCRMRRHGGLFKQGESDK